MGEIADVLHARPGNKRARNNQPTGFDVPALTEILLQRPIDNKLHCPLLDDFFVGPDLEHDPARKHDQSKFAGDDIQAEFAIFAKLSEQAILRVMKSIYDPNYTEMISHLKNVRRTKKVSQIVLAEKMGWDNRDVSKVENLVRRLDLIELCYWLDALEYSLEDFLREIGRLK